MQAMILAAGLGTRLKPITDTKPKALVEVGGIPMLELAIRHVKKYRVERLVINLHHFPDQIKDFLKQKDNFGLDISFSDESDALLNTGGAIKKARQFLDPNVPFFLMAVDILTNLDLNAMMDFHIKNKPIVTLAVKDRPTSRSLLFNNNLQLKGWRNNQTGELKGVVSNKNSIALGFSTIHIIEGAFSIMDIYLRIMKDHTILGFRHDEDIWLEFGRIENIRELENREEFRRIVRHFT
jgi:MurNAc alpha-1-phosphate uridylyltransferase